MNTVNNSNKSYMFKTAGAEWMNHLANGFVSAREVKVTIKLNATISEVILEEAVNIIIKREPILACNFNEKCNPPVWTICDKAEGFFEFYIEEEHDTMVEHFLESEHVIENGQLKVILIRNNEYDTICVAIDHTCSDARGVKEFVNTLSQVYTKLYEKKELDHFVNNNQSRDCGVIFDMLNIKDISSILEHPQAKSNPTWSFPLKSSESKITKYKTLSYNEKTFERIKKNCKSLDATINDVFLSAFYRSLFEINHQAYDSEEMEVIVTTDLRKYFTDATEYSYRNMSGNLYVNLSRKKEGFCATIERIKKRMDALKQDRPGIYNIAALEMLTKMNYMDVEAFNKCAFNLSLESGKATPKFSNIGMIAENKLVFGDVCADDIFLLANTSYAPNSVFCLQCYNQKITFTISYFNSDENDKVVSNFFKVFDEQMNVFLEECSCECNGTFIKPITEVFHELSCYEDKGIYYHEELGTVFVSYREHYERATKVLGWLQKNGVSKGSSLIFQFVSIKNFLETFWACQLGGIIAVPLPIAMTKEQQIRIFNIYKSFDSAFYLEDKMLPMLCEEYQEEAEFVKHKLLWTNSEIEDLKTVKLYDSKLDDIAVIQFSSGSTGAPKGVLLSNYNIAFNIKRMIVFTSLTKDDIMLGFLPMTHDFGLIAHHLVPAFREIDQHHILTQDFIKSPMFWLNKCSQYRATIISAPNFAFRHVIEKFDKEKLDSELNLSCVRAVINGSEPVNCDFCTKFADILSEYGLKEESICPSYGMAEATLAISIDSYYEPIDVRYINRNGLVVGSQVQYLDKGDFNAIAIVGNGKPLLGFNIFICDDDNNQLMENYVGNIHIKSNSVTKGYFNNEEETNKLLHDGWMFSGDIGFISDKKIFITGRAKDIIFINGQNYYPYDIENVIMSHNKWYVGRISIVGVPNKNTKQDEIIAFILYDGEIKDFVSVITEIKKLSTKYIGYTVDRIIPIEKFPMTNSGKIQKFALKSLYEEGSYDKKVSILEELQGQITINETSNNDSLATNYEITDLHKEMKQIFTEVIGETDFGYDDNFFDIGINSMRLTQVQGKIEEIYAIKIDTTELINYKSINELVKYVSFVINPSKLIQFNGIKLGEEYLAVTTGFHPREKIVFIPNNDCFKLDKSKEVIMPAVLALLLGKLTDSNCIPLYSVDHNCCVVENMINLDAADSFDDICSMMKDAVTAPKISIDNLDGIKACISKDMITILCGNSNSIRELSSSIHSFDFVLEVEDEKAECIINYNTQKMNHNGVEKIITYLTNLIDVVVE